jgi:hypothetical protein
LDGNVWLFVGPPPKLGDGLLRGTLKLVNRSEPPRPMLLSIESCHALTVSLGTDASADYDGAIPSWRLRHPRPAEAAPRNGCEKVSMQRSLGASGTWLHELQ